MDQAAGRIRQGAISVAEEEHAEANHVVCVGQCADGQAPAPGFAGMNVPAGSQTGVRAPDESARNHGRNATARTDLTSRKLPDVYCLIQLGGLGFADLP